MICIDCVTPAPLKKLFDTHGTEGECRYCGRLGHAIELNQLFNYVYERVAENVTRKDDLSYYELTMLYHGGSDYITVSTIDVVLMEWFELESEPYFADLCDGGTLEQNSYEAR